MIDRFFFFLAALGAMAGPVLAQPQSRLNTWILVCPKSMDASECNLTTSTKWLHMRTPQTSANTAAIKAARAKVERSLEPGFYTSVEQFPVGVSMGPYGDLFKACASKGAAPASPEAAAWASKGGCLE